ncbi:MAG TPA: hypothetical protein VKX17_18780 [Planctomycetota bacterium]|nr:hypothetical protein [Planctomycetota bacterium]
MRKLLAATALFALVMLGTACAFESWEERAWRQLNRKVTVDFVDTKLSDGLNFVQQFTGLTIIMDPKVRKNDPLVTIRVNDMDAGTFIKWLTQLTDTYADVKDQAIYITDKPSEADVEDEKTDLAMMAAQMKAEIELPPQGVPLTDADRVKIALKMIEKLDVKPTDFPGPDIGLGIKDAKDAAANPFGQQTKP